MEAAIGVGTPAAVIAERVLQAILKQRPVREPRQVVVERLRFQLALDLGDQSVQALSRRTLTQICGIDRRAKFLEGFAQLLALHCLVSGPWAAPPIRPPSRGSLRDRRQTPK